AVVEEAAGAPVHLGGVQPTPHWGDPDSAYRRAIVAPPRSRLRFPVRVPAGGALRFSTAVEGQDRTAGVRFTVAVDGRPVFARTLDPAARRRDRHWFDERVDLSRWADKDVEIALATESTGAGVTGTPGWSHVRLVRESRRARQAASAAAPSVLVVLVDTLRADQLGCYGAAPSPSPVVDRLAAGGLVFEHAVAQSSWTMPSVATLFTGLHPRSHGLIGPSADAAGAASDPGFLADTLPTLAERAEAAGVTTVGVSGSPIVSRATNLARGFETFVEFGWDRARNDWPPAAAVNARFLAWLERNRGLRFLAYLHYMDPHDPYTPPASLRPPAPPGVRSAIAAGQVDGLARQVNAPGGSPLAAVEVEHLRQLYDAEIRAWDAALGTLLDALAAHGLADSTIVVLTADHGEEFQEHGRLKHRIHLYDELLHVPLVIAGPGIRPGRVAEQAQGIDLFPTVAALLGTAAPHGLPGHDLLAARPETPAISETLYGLMPDGTTTPIVSLRTAEWKLIHAPALGRYELYDLRRDPGEREDRFGNAAEGAALAARLAEWETTAPAPPRAEGSDPALGEKLRALGYVD
ncbi:MAG TPA: sulfatase, partial [Verrucomicrobiae bacterium]|nr:sulfatase [Verrucomicrobiae bacterium]